MPSLQRGRLAPSQPLWFRWLAALCLVLVAGVSTGQAAHVHGEWLPDPSHHVSLPADASQGTGEEHCPLCVAMHSAMAATLQIAPEPVQCVVATVAATAVRAPQKRWSFAMFSRPPPSAARTQATGLVVLTAPFATTAG